MKIKVFSDDLNDGEVINLLVEHHAEMHLYSPPESIHALDVSEFHHPSLQFWSARVGGKRNGQIAGCGALMELSGSHGEIKSMRTSKKFLRTGVAALVLQEILNEAAIRKYQRVSLETGTHHAFDPATLLYKKFGFVEVGPFANYKIDPHSRFMSKLID